jgi:hypothetical protein
MTFHHDPGHSEDELDRQTAPVTVAVPPSRGVTSGAEGAMSDVGATA